MAAFHFYTVSSLIMIAMLLASAGILACAPKKKGDIFLVFFVFSLVANTVWGFAGPIAAGIEAQAIVFYGDFASRVISLAGYVFLLLFAIERRRKS
jgi:hypothetical protein